VATAFDGLQRNGMAGPDVNLFSEKWSVGPGAEAGEAEAGAYVNVGFASFENTLITLTVRSEHYQCVWNAARIADNRAFPGASVNTCSCPRTHPGRREAPRPASRGILSSTVGTCRSRCCHCRTQSREHHSCMS
jgi:hypothetical protein